MGRRSGGSRGGSARAAPRRSASTRTSSPRRAAPPPARAAARKPAPAKSAAPPPAKAAAAAPPQKQGSAMGGFMANVASTGLGVMAGRAMDRAFFGGGGAEGHPETVPADDGSAVDPYATETFSYEAEEVDPSVCAREVLEFKKCLQRTNTDMQACQWNYDVLLACQKSDQAQMGFADTGRL